MRAPRTAAPLELAEATMAFVLALRHLDEEGLYVELG
jgi:hypothetical protein